MADDEEAVDPLEVWIPTTETLDYDRLEALAEASRVPSFEPTASHDDEIDGIVFQARDTKDAAFWRKRGEFWGSPDYPNFIPTEDALA